MPGQLSQENVLRKSLNKERTRAPFWKKEGAMKRHENWKGEKQTNNIKPKMAENLSSSLKEQ